MDKVKKKKSVTGLASGYATTDPRFSGTAGWTRWKTAGRVDPHS
jgi:hypothetical protein